MKKLILALIVTCFVAVGCKNEAKKEDKKATTEIAKSNFEEVSFKVSGMTCEVGCAKSIASKLSKLEGVEEAKVVFADSIAKVKFDKTKTDGKKLMAYVNGMTNNMYKTSDMKVCEKKCDASKKTSKNKVEAGCSPDCTKKDCQSKKKGETEKTASKKDCPKGCCDEKASASTCKPDCKNVDCNSKATKTADAKSCQKSCCEKA